MSAVVDMSRGMAVSELLDGFDVDAPAVEVSDISTHSGRVMPGGLFLACAGSTTHGLRFVGEVLERGVACIAWEPAPDAVLPDVPESVATVAVPGLRARLGEIANRFFGEPSGRMQVTGITGTNGKSSVAWLAAQGERLLGGTCGYMGTLGFGIPPDLAPSPLTTPDCIEFHRRLRDVLDMGASRLMAEVSSHGLAQDRVDGVRFHGAVLTNISRDHLDYHESMDAYREAKARLFLDHAPGFAVLNVGDAFGAELSERLPPGTECIKVRVARPDESDEEASIVVTLAGFSPAGLEVDISGAYGSAHIVSPLWGRFNAENLAVALGILVGEGHPMPAAAAALAECSPPPGRMQAIDGGAGRPLVVVDFAHTPDALRKALTALRDHTQGRVWLVFGCGGDRDTGKRAPMGAVAASLADKVVVTDDNPRHEDPAKIVADVASGANDSARVEVIQDRAAAIQHAIRSAGEGDVVLVAGKGHEEYQLIGDDAVEFSDTRIARAALGMEQ